ncbi:hypothetical protein HDV03_004843 [Kappamyces sp. JEL0829]|nr:hypothetical protein HDV03_004843 [Kappamyces sp. JEL0829]
MKPYESDDDDIPQILTVKGFEAKKRKTVEIMNSSHATENMVVDVISRCEEFQTRWEKIRKEWKHILKDHENCSQKLLQTLSEHKKELEKHSVLVQEERQAFLQMHLLHND